jgi:hypothetical protein
MNPTHVTSKKRKKEVEICACGEVAVARGLCSDCLEQARDAMEDYDYSNDNEHIWD